jgi:hypothetical protein
MSFHNEQISKRHKPRHRSTMQRDYKRWMNRLRRRAEKRDPENAPTRNRYFFWTD